MLTLGWRKKDHSLDNTRPGELRRESTWINEHKAERLMTERLCRVKRAESNEYVFELLGVLFLCHNSASSDTYA